MFSEVFVGLAAIVVVIQIIRSRKYGPRVNWIPRRWRVNLNHWYERHGWSAPYDEAGNKQPWWRNDR